MRVNLISLVFSQRAELRLFSLWTVCWFNGSWCSLSHSFSFFFFAPFVSFVCSFRGDAGPLLLYLCHIQHLYHCVRTEHQYRRRWFYYTVSCISHKEGSWHESSGSLIITYSVLYDVLCCCCSFLTHNWNQTQLNSLWLSRSADFEFAS